MRISSDGLESAPALDLPNARFTISPTVKANQAGIMCVATIRSDRVRLNHPNWADE
jgi:hypothetical protein